MSFLREKLAFVIVYKANCAENRKIQLFIKYSHLRRGFLQKYEIRLARKHKKHRAGNARRGVERQEDQHSVWANWL